MAKKSMIEKLYDNLIEEAERLMKDFDPCGWKKRTDSHGNKVMMCNRGRKNGCCYECPLQTPNGCPTQNLSCKLYICGGMAFAHMSSKHHVQDAICDAFNRQATRIKAVGYNMGLYMNYFVSKEDILKYTKNRLDKKERRRRKEYETNKGRNKECC